MTVIYNKNVTRVIKLLYPSISIDSMYIDSKNVDAYIGAYNYIVSNFSESDSVFILKELIGYMVWTGQDDKAIEYYHKLIILEPNICLHYIMLGLLYRKIGRTGKAIELMEKAINIDPNCLEAYVNFVEMSSTDSLARYGSYERNYTEKDAEDIQNVIQKINISNPKDRHTLENTCMLHRYFEYCIHLLNYLISVDLIHVSYSNDLLIKIETTCINRAKTDIKNKDYNSSILWLKTLTRLFPGNTEAIKLLREAEYNEQNRHREEIERSIDDIFNREWDYNAEK